MKTRALFVLVLCAVFTGFLLWMVVGHERARSNGDEVILDMEPVDPRSLFRGYYVIISTPLHRLAYKDIPAHKPFKKGDRIFVSFAPATTKCTAPCDANQPATNQSATPKTINIQAVDTTVGTQEPVLEDQSLASQESPLIITALSHVKPAEGTFLQGRVSWASSSPENKTRYRVKYNIESYFADKSGAKMLEDKIEDSKMRIILSVDDKGNAVIRGLEIDGTRLIDKL